MAAGISRPGRPNRSTIETMSLPTVRGILRKQRAHSVVRSYVGRLRGLLLLIASM